ncbi:MAG: hypothetical protein Q9159_002868 [Coniocarpon cinnabarinum]
MDGVEECRQALVDFSEKSPLYGFLRFHEKSIVIKCIPEGTSRLLQGGTKANAISQSARTAVHFPAVQEKFSPQDAVLTLSVADELCDATLRRELNLPEEAENPSQRLSHDATESQDRGGPQRVPGEESAKDRANLLSSDKTGNGEEQENQPTIPRPGVARKHNAADELQKELDDLDRDIKSGNSKPPHERKSPNDIIGLKAFLAEVSPPRTPATDNVRREAKLLPDPDILRHDWRLSESDDLPKTSYSARPSTSDLWHTWKPKLKFGPRPVAHDPPRGPAMERQKLPAGVRMRAQKSTHDERTSSQKRQTERRSGAVSEDGESQSRSSSRHTSKPIEPQRAHKEDELPPVPQLPEKFEEAGIRDTPSGLDTPLMKPLPETPKNDDVGPSADRDVEIVAPANPTGLGISTSPIPQSRPTSTASTAAPAVTPERNRLMRALRLRRHPDASLYPDESPLPAFSPLLSPYSQAFAPTLHDSGKPDSGIDIEQVHASPVTLTESSFSAKVNPLQSHPVNTDNSIHYPPSQDAEESSPPLKFVTALPQQSQESPTGHRQVEDMARVPLRRSSSLKRKREDFSNADVKPVRNDSNSNAVTLHEAESVEGMSSVHLQQSHSPVLPFAHHRDASAGSPTITTATIRTALSHQEVTTSPDGALPNARIPELHVSATPSIERPPSSSSRPANPGRANLTTGISRRIQTLAERSHKPESDVASREDYLPGSVHTFLAPKTSDSKHQKADITTAMGRAYEASRSRSPNKRSTGTPKTNRPKTSADHSRSGSVVAESIHTGGSGHNSKRDSYPFTTRAARLNADHSPLPRAASIIEEPSGVTDDDVNAHSLQEERFGRSMAFSRPGGSFTERNDHSRSPAALRRNSAHSDNGKRPASRSSIMSGRARPSFEGLRTALSGNRRESGSTSRHRPNTSKPLLHARGDTIREEGSEANPDHVHEVSEIDTLASKASRLLKRMSQMPNGSNSKRSEFKVVREGAQPNRSTKSRKTSNTFSGFGEGKNVVVGDVNVQFADTLLWKRRWVEIDTLGNLVFAPPPASPDGRAGRVHGRKYHLTEFLPPAIPPSDRQEMRHSVILEFVETGGNLQLAAEDRRQQEALMKMAGLVDAHRNWLYKL